jgi:hypothetical protein
MSTLYTLENYVPATMLTRFIIASDPQRPLKVLYWEKKNP